MKTAYFIVVAVLAPCALSMGQVVDRGERPSGPYKPPETPQRTSVPARVGGANAQGRSGPMPVSVQANVNGAGMNILGDAANEPTITVDPIDPRRMAVGWRQFDTVTDNFRQAGRAYSTDGGRTWIAASPLEPGVFRSDPVMRSDAAGRFYYLSLSMPNGNLVCEIFPSLDGGATFPTKFEALGGDKQWLAIDQNVGAASFGYIYQLWSNSFSRSADMGHTWWSPAVSGNTVFCTLVVGPDSVVYMAGSNNNGSVGPIRFTKSTNAQNGAVAPLFSPKALVNLGGNQRVSLGASSPNPDGLMGQIYTDVDRSNGPRRGWVYVLGSVGPRTIGGVSDPLDVMFIRSTDGGTTWSSPVRINDSTATVNDWQWFGGLGVAPNGRLDAVWYDTRASQNAVLSEVYYSFSNDGGTTWSPNMVVAPQFNSQIGFPNQNKIGDYLDIHSDELGADVIYGATYNGEEDVWYMRIGPRICPADINHSGAVTLQDLFDFLTLFFANDIRADIHRDFTITTQDLFDYLALWFGPCTQ